jgi:TonB family protein
VRTILLAALVAMTTVSALAPAMCQVATSSETDIAGWRADARKHLITVINRAKPQMRTALKASGVGRCDIVLAIEVMVTRSGRITSARIAQTSGFAEVDSWAERTVARSGPLPALPSQFTRAEARVVAPIRIVFPADTCEMSAAPEAESVQCDTSAA